MPLDDSVKPIVARTPVLKANRSLLWIVNPVDETEVQSAVPSKMDTKSAKMQVRSTMLVQTGRAVIIRRLNAAKRVETVGECGG